MTAPPLIILIAEARAELNAETPIRLHTSHASKLLDADGVVTRYPDEGGIGLPFTADFHRLLALRERFQPDYLMRESLFEVNDWCHAKHVEHRIEGEVIPLCGRLAYVAVRGNVDPDSLAAITGMRHQLVRDLLTNALVYAANWRGEQRARREVIENAYASETMGERLRREHDLKHEQRAWELLRGKYRALPPWDDEQARRMDEHQRLGCEGCPWAVAA